MFKYRIRTFFNELKVLLLMRSGTNRRSDSGTDPDTQTRMRGLAIGSCGWPAFNCSQRDDEEEYYGADPRPRSLAFESNEDRSKDKAAGLEAVSLPSLSESGMRSPQCRICFQGPEKVCWWPWNCVGHLDRGVWSMQPAVLLVTYTTGGGHKLIHALHKLSHSTKKTHACSCPDHYKMNDHKREFIVKAFQEGKKIYIWF